jgi:type II secretory pathway pseudopilin PulG
MTDPQSEISNLESVVPFRRPRWNGFTLIEVVLAIGIFLVTILALVGLLGPTLQSVDEVEKADEVASVVNTLNAFLQNSPEIETAADSKFDAIFKAVTSNNEATVFVYRYYDDSQPGEPIRLEAGFAPGEPVGNNAIVNQPGSNPADFANAAGPIYRAVLTASSVIPERYRSPGRDGNGIYTMAETLPNYNEGYFAMEVRIFAEEPPGPGGTFVTATNLTVLADIEPIFTYNTAVVR